MHKPLAFLPPPPSALFAVYQDDEDENELILKPIDYFVLLAAPIEDESIVGFSVNDGFMHVDENFVCYAKDKADAQKRAAELKASADNA